MYELVILVILVILSSTSIKYVGQPDSPSSWSAWPVATGRIGSGSSGTGAKTPDVCRTWNIPFLDLVPGTCKEMRRDMVRGERYGARGARWKR